PFCLVVACLAKRLQRTEPKGALVATVRNDVIGDGCRDRSIAAGLAHAAPRLDPQLMLAALDPTSVGIPRMPRSSFLRHQRAIAVVVFAMIEAAFCRLSGEVDRPQFLKG